MEVFGIIGMSMGSMGFVFAISAMCQVSALEKRLRESGALPSDDESDQTD